ELLRLSKEEFGLPRDGPITLPCYAAVLEKNSRKKLVVAIFG
ncbi:hypothetical protein POUND7_018201, partial [Theobroma cacao]